MNFSIKSLFSATGRVGRLAYFLPPFVMGMIAAILMGIGMIGADGSVNAIYYIGALVSLLTSVVAIFQGIKRMHDLDKPGAHILFLLVPFYNIYIGIILLFKRGTVGPNQFGPDPLEGK